MVLKGSFAEHLRGILVASAILAALALSWTRAFDLYELQTYDWRFQLRGPRPVSDRIVLVDIWDDTLEGLGAWPIDRDYHAILIRALHAAGAEAVAFDILFSEPKPGDEEVTRSAEEAGNVYFVYAFDAPKRGPEGFLSTGFAAPLLDSYAAAAKGTGFVNAKADRDGKRRRMVPMIRYQDKKYHQLSFRLAMDTLGVPSIEALNVPIDDENCFIINYAGTWEKTFKHYSYLDILAAYTESLKGSTPRVSLSELKGKICFVGLTSLGSHDVNPTPVQAVYPMVGSYANALNSILQKDYIRRLDRLWNLLILIVLGTWVAYFSSRSRPLKALLTTGLTIGVFVLSTVLLFCFWGIWVDLFYSLVVSLFIYLGMTLTRAIFEKRKRELLENELKIASRIQQSFLPPSVPDEKGICVAVFMKPAKAVGGDLYAFLPSGEGRLGVMVGDVSGKGMPAALFMAKAVSEFKFSARDKTDPSEVLTALNNSISSESTGGLFMTVAYAFFDLKASHMTMSDAGHLPVVAMSGKKARLLYYKGGGPPIGVLAGAPYSNVEIPLKTGECFVFYSDGVSEARNHKKEEYGVEKLLANVEAHAGFSADEILKNVIEDLGRFMGNAEQHDDITLIIVKIEEDALLGQK